MAEIERFHLSQHVSTLFSTLFVCYDWADNTALNQDLATLLLELENANKGCESLQCGWLAVWRQSYVSRSSGDSPAQAAD